MIRAVSRITMTIPRAVLPSPRTPGVVPFASTLCVTHARVGVTVTPAQGRGTRTPDCHTGHKSPCTLWHWNIYPHSDPGLSHPVDLRDDKYRDPDLESGKNYEAPNLNDSLAFGMLRDNYVPPTSPCTVKEGDTSRGVTQLLPGEEPGTLGCPGARGSFVHLRG